MMINSYVISVSLQKGCYRHIQISSSATLYKLHQAIIDSFGFDDNHLHAFFMNNYIWDPSDAYYSVQMKGFERLTKKYTLKKLNLQKGDKFKYLFDFGDEWRFQCRILRELEEKTAVPRVIRSVGAAPDQYAMEDDVLAWDLEPLLEGVYEQEQIDRMYKELSVSKDIIGNLYCYMNAAANVYGIVPLKKVFDLYNSQNEPISKEDFLSVIDIMCHDENEFLVLGAESMYVNAPPSLPMDREVISMEILVLGIGKYYDLVEMQAGKDYAPLKKEEVFLYSDSFYYPPTFCNMRMQEFFKKRKKRLNISVKNMVSMIHGMIRIEFSMEEIAIHLNMMGFDFQDEKELREFLDIYQQMNNHCRKFANRGYTPDELYRAGL